MGLLFAGIASILSMMAFYVWKKRRISREHQLVPGTAENRRKRQDRKRSMINIIMAETIWNGAVTVFDFIMDNLVIINVLLSLVIVFFQRRSPQTVWTWLLLLYFIPILGFVLYLIIGQDFHKSRMFKAKEIEGEVKYALSQSLSPDNFCWQIPR